MTGRVGSAWDRRCCRRYGYRLCGHRWLCGLSWLCGWSDRLEQRRDRRVGYVAELAHLVAHHVEGCNKSTARNVAARRHGGVHAAERVVKTVRRRGVVG